MKFGRSTKTAKQQKQSNLITVFRLLLLAGICSLMSLTWAQDAPENIDLLLDQFDADNPPAEDDEEDVIDDYGIATYGKSRTQFDGVTHELQVTYLQLSVDQGVEIPIMSTGVSGQNIDFSVMMWFKIDQDFYTPRSVPPQIMYLFSFEDSVACFFTDALTLMCDSWDRRKLQIKSEELAPGIWYHLTLSSQADGESFLLIQDSDHKVVAQDSVQRFGFRQNTLYGWKACLGDCAADFGFFGGVREIIMVERALTIEEADRAKNMIFTYDSSIKAYFRFQDMHNKFEKDEFVDWPWLSYKNQPSRRDEYIRASIIPNDVCPSLFDQITPLKFSGDNMIQDFTIDQELLQREYSYTMSMTIQVNETACTTVDPSQAASDCNLVKLEGVFMLYLMGRNTARFFFFANKNYYESASQMIFIPYDQWITIQMSVEQYDGYTIVISDQNGNAFFRTRVEQNMHEQWPTQQLSLFRAFDGFVEHFYLTNEVKELHPFYATNFRGDDNALIDMYFTKDQFSNNGFANKGALRKQFILSGDGSFEDVFFKMPSEGGNVEGTLQDPTRIFDGIACNDRHMTTHLDTKDSYISFPTPPLKEWSSENSIEFWFKVDDPGIYNQNVIIFSMVSSVSNPQDYYHIYIENGDLKCAPFGNKSSKDPVITFDKFKLTNQDTYGWWHVSCSYAFQKNAKGTLKNSNVSQSLEETMLGLPKFYPTNSLLATFGKQVLDTGDGLPGAASVLIKEFRFWNKQLSKFELDNNRYRQVDPTKLQAELLLIYLRMATGSSLVDNFAARNEFYDWTGFTVAMNELSFVEDFMETEKYSYVAELDLVVSQKSRTYHTVCPVHTYYMDQYCYSEPVNKAILAIFPVWNDQANSLSWEMSLYHSSMINSDVTQFLTDQFSSEDPILQKFFQESETRLEHQVPSDILRHEAEYQITAELTNEELTFLQSASLKFTPSKCKWLTVVDHVDASTGYDVYEVSPGTQDIQFSLELKRNPQLDCSQFDFFNSFNGLDFDFIMTDTTDYISYKPNMIVSARNPVTQELVQDGEQAPESMIVDISLAAREQDKLPVFQDIMILINVHWTSATHGADIELTEDIIFQHVLYTIKFEPTANVLFAELVISQSDIIRGETLILDAGNSYISNMPESQQRRILGYDWECPDFLNAYCRTQASSQLVVPYSQVSQSAVVFDEPFDFSVVVIWAKGDGTNEKAASETVTATWFDLVVPEYTIDFDKGQTKITSDQNSLFYLEALNFDVASIYDYDVVWSIEPELENEAERSILSGGRVMQINKGAYSENTSYEVTLTMTHKKLAKVSQSYGVAFETLAPPVGGNIAVSPLQGFIGDEFTVTLSGWTSANLPIEYNVYSTLDSGGLRKGFVLNEDGPIPVDESFSFTASKVTPIIVTVFDASEETLEFPLQPSIQLKPEESAEDSTSESAADEAESASESSSSGDVAPKPEDLPSPENLMIKIQGTQVLSQRVNYMNIAIETVQRIDDKTFGEAENIDEQIEFRRQLLAEIEKDLFMYVQKDDPLIMSAEDLITESFRMLAQLTANHRYLDQDIVETCRDVIGRLTTMETNLFDLQLESSGVNSSFHSNYFTALENLNQYARIHQVEDTLLWVRSLLESTMDKMCDYISLPEVYSFNSEVEELGFSLFRFDQQKALQNKRGTMRALDASYSYSAFAMYNWFTTSQPGELCMQVYSQQFGTVSMRGAYVGNSKARLQATVYEPGTGEHYSMGELSGKTIASFDLDRSTFKNNQTMCMGYSKLSKRWHSDLCQSELSVEKVTMKCTCNAFESNLIGIFSDFTRTLGEQVTFPRMEFDSDKQLLTVVPPSIDPVLSGGSITESGRVTDEKQVGLDDITGTNYVWMGETVLIAIFCFTASVIAIRMDNKDALSHSLSRTSPVAATVNQNHFIDEVAKELKENYAQVCLRQQSLLHYRTIFGSSSFPHLMSQLHPLLSPFTSYDATQSRFMRFSVYMLQLNIVSICIFLYFGPSYRTGDLERNEEVIDSFDILCLLMATLTCSVLFTPWLSEPLLKACSNQIVLETVPPRMVNNIELGGDKGMKFGDEIAGNLNQNGQLNHQTTASIKTRRQGLRFALIILSVITSVTLPVWAIVTTNSVPASNQYCMATTVIGSLFAATLGTNLIYLWLNACLARKVAFAGPNGKTSKGVKLSQCLSHHKALQILRDMKAVIAVKDQFTLADVLPSSLECSRDMMSNCSHHASVSGHHQSNNASHNIEDSKSFKRPQPSVGSEKSLMGCDFGHLSQSNADVEHKETVEARDDASDGRQATELLQADDSQRALNKPDEASQQEVSSNHMLDLTGLNDATNNHLLIATMLKDSIHDLDISRNDVVPQRTQLDYTIPDCDESVKSSQQSSQQEGEAARVHVDECDSFQKSAMLPAELKNPDDYDQDNYEADEGALGALEAEDDQARAVNKQGGRQRAQNRQAAGSGIARMSNLQTNNDARLSAAGTKIILQ